MSVTRSDRRIWTVDEIRRVLAVIDRQSAAGKRDYAMILATARLGLRISDLRQLELSDLDWRAKTITIVQHKTRRPLSLPLLDDVGLGDHRLRRARPPGDRLPGGVRQAPTPRSTRSGAPRRSPAGCRGIQVRALADESVEVTGTVPDVDPYLARSRVVVAPLRAGGGTRLKIMEALDVGRPVVATSVGCEGMEDLVGRGVVVADTAAGLADAIGDLLLDPVRAAMLGRAGHDAVTADHTWDAALAPLMEAVRTP